MKVIMVKIMISIITMTITRMLQQYNIAIRMIALLVVTTKMP